MKAKPNRYVDNGDGMTTIVITKASGAEFECLIDAADVPIVNFQSWYVHTNGYVRGGCPGIYMHRLLLEAKVVDHANRDKRDNRRTNLRPADQRKNMCNSKLLVSNSTCIKNVWFRNNNPRHSTFAVAEVRLGEERLKKEFNVSKLGLLEATYAAAKYARGLRNDLHGEFARHV
jgi:HNH endonuclease